MPDVTINLWTLILGAASGLAGVLGAKGGNRFVMGAVFGAVTAAILTIADSFKTALQIASPFMVFALVYNLGLGVLQKLMPQFQVYFLAMPLTIMIGLAILASLVATILGLYRSFMETGLMRLVPT